MASAAYRKMTVEEFLAIEWDVSDSKAELDDGRIRMMAGGTAAHARVQGRVFGALFAKLKGSRCQPFGPDMGVRTAIASLRYPDVSVFCGRNGPDDDSAQAFDDPVVIVEVLSPSTRSKDLGAKLREYRLIPSVRHVLYIDPDAETLRLLNRAPTDWIDEDVTTEPTVALSAIGIELTWDEIFART